MRTALVVVAVAITGAVALAVAGAPAGAGGGVVRPEIVVKPIPFSAARKAQTESYAMRHYGIKTWQLRQPKVIVEHFTASDTFSSAFNTFAANSPDQELGELPGTCAHFVVDKDGTIYQLVPVSIMCRHTVGLNWVSIGIEHVGTSDAEILSNPKQMASSLALTAWLMSRFHIRLADVIGHNESLTSRFHREAYSAWRCQTHGDWSKADMTIYRGRLSRFASDRRIELGGPVSYARARC